MCPWAPCYNLKQLYLKYRKDPYDKIKVRQTTSPRLPLTTLLDQFQVTLGAYTLQYYKIVSEKQNAASFTNVTIRFASLHCKEIANIIVVSNNIMIIIACVVHFSI